MTSSVELVSVAHFLGDGLSIPDWRICSGQGWCVFGRNGSGKQLLDRLLVGELVLEAGLIDRKIAVADIALISFESQQAVYEHERPVICSVTMSREPVSLTFCRLGL